MNYIKVETLAGKQISLLNYLPDRGMKKIREEILAGLNSFPKYISPKFFYDRRGSELFEEITRLVEYYPTRTEKKILSTLVRKLGLELTNLQIVELGSGDCSKIRIFLRQIAENDLTSLTYYPVDISQSAIEKSTEKLAYEFPMIQITGIVADFMHQLGVIPKNGKRLFCFLGSTIGNLNPIERDRFLKHLGCEMAIGDGLLLGIDMVKDVGILEKAYNDNRQITAQFNLNVLNVVNSLIDSNFEPAAFEHLAFYNQNKKRVEMHLKARHDMTITFNSGIDHIHLKKDETIHTENSHKFDDESIKTMGMLAGLTLEQVVTDENQWFSLAYFKKNR